MEIPATSPTAAGHGQSSPGTGRLPSRAWLAYLVGAVTLGMAVATMGEAPMARSLQTAMGLAAGAAILVGVRSHRPILARAWCLLAASLWLTSIGAALSELPGVAGSAGQAVDGIGNLLGVAALITLMRRRIPGGDRAALLDAAILASGVGVLVWSLGFAPLVITAGQGSAIPFALFYPTLIALAVVARLWFVGGADRPATRLVILFLLASNALTGIDASRDLLGRTTLEGAHVLAIFVTLAFVGAAALHPSMAFAAERQQPDSGRISRRRLAALTVALLVNPATLALQVSSGRQLDAAPYLISGVVIGLLVVIRLGDALRRLGESLTERDELMKLLRHQASYDALTALPNRTLFDERLTAAMAERTSAAKLAVLMIDIDDFKGVNDRSGHAAGDAVLVAVGSRLRGVIRAGDTAARFGGDEFVVALPACVDANIPVRVAERILAAMDLPLQIGASAERIRVSIGIVIAAVDDRTTDDLVRKADVAMYRSKTAGKGRITLFGPGMEATPVARPAPPNVLHRQARLGGLTA